MKYIKKKTQIKILTILPMNLLQDIQIKYSNCSPLCLTRRNAKTVWIAAPGLRATLTSCLTIRSKWRQVKSFLSYWIMLYYLHENIYFSFFSFITRFTPNDELITLSFYHFFFFFFSVFFLFFSLFSHFISLFFTLISIFSVSNMTLSELVVGYTNWTMDPSGIADKGIYTVYFYGFVLPFCC